MFKIKAVGDMVLDVLAVPFGGPGDLDSDGEFFTSETDLHLQQFKDPLILYWHGLDSSGDRQDKPEIIGQALSHSVKEDGLWIRVQLDKANEFAQRVWRAAKQGIAAASSGSVAHLIRKAADGFISSWPLIELSLFDVDKNRSRLPSNKNAIALPAAKALYTQAGRDFPEIETEEYISDAETKALQARAREVIAEIDDYFLKSAVDKALIDRAFEREPTKAEQLYEAAAVGAVNFYANTRIKSLPVRVMDYMPEATNKDMRLLGRYERDDQGNPRIMLQGGGEPVEEYKTFLHETGHAIDRHVIGDGEFYFDPQATKSIMENQAAREDRADEYRKMLKSIAWNQACLMFHYGSWKVTKMPVNELLLALKAHNPYT